MTSFWDKWAELIKKNGVTRDELAALIEILHQFDHEWESKGREPPITAAFLKRYPKWLVYSDPEMRLRGR